MAGKATGPARGDMPAVAAAALGVAIAALVGAAAVVDPGPGGIEAVVTLPPDPGPRWGAAWSSFARTPEALEAAALTDGVVRAAMGLAALSLLGLLTALLRSAGLREAVRPALAVRWALGASPRTLFGELLARARPRLVRGCIGGLAAGAGLALLLRASWPVDGSGAGPSPALLLLAPLLVLPVALALGSPVLGLPSRSVPLLRTGSGGTDDPRAGTVRRAAATLQLAAAVALVLAGATLGADAGAREADEGLTGGDTLLVPLRPLAAGLDWSAVERLLGAAPSESLSTPGAWTGHGVRDLVTVECGRCSRGGLPLPMYGVSATVHAVSPGFFAGAGLEILAGRGFTPDDLADGTSVGVVSASFARDHFEGGRPLGRRIRLGGGVERWVTVVGVVAPLAYQAPGSATPGTPVLYVPLAQHPADAVVWAVRGGEPEALPLPAAAQVVATGPALTLEARRAAARSPVRWVGRSLLIAGVAGLLLALAGAAEVAAAEARGRWREAAVRAAVGAPPARLVVRFLRRVVATALLGSALGWIVAWSVVESTGGARIPPASAWALAAALVAASLVGAARPAGHAAAADPAALLRAGG